MAVHRYRAEKTLRRWIAAGGAAVLLLSGAAFADSQLMIARASFDVPLTLVKDSDISFGILKAATSGTYVIDTNGSVSASGGGAVVGGSGVQGQVTISGSTTQTVTISTGSYAANNGVTPSSASCNYDGAPIANCDAGGAALAAPGSSGKVLKLGLTIVADGTQAAGSTAAPSFTVTVAYD